MQSTEDRARPPEELPPAEAPAGPCPCGSWVSVDEIR